MAKMQAISLFLWCFLAALNVINPLAHQGSGYYVSVYIYGEISGNKNLYSSFNSFRQRYFLHLFFSRNDISDYPFLIFVLFFLMIRFPTLLFLFFFKYIFTLLPYIPVHTPPLEKEIVLYIFFIIKVETLLQNLLSPSSFTPPSPSPLA